MMSPARQHDAEHDIEHGAEDVAEHDAEHDGATAPTLYRLSLRPEPSGPDHLGRLPSLRLRAVLKYALRACSLRCIAVAETGPEPPDDTEDP